MTINRGRRRMPLTASEIEDEEEDEVVGDVDGSTDPRDLARYAADAAWQAYRATKAGTGVYAQRWAAVSEAFSRAVDAAMQTQTRYAVKEEDDPSTTDWIGEDQPINPHQRIGVLSEDEIQTVMALRRGDARVFPVRGEVMHPAMADRADAGGTQIHDIVLGHVDGGNHTGRLMWCLVSQLMALTGDTEVVIPQAQWDESGGGQVTVTQRVDGGRLIRRS